MCHWSRVSVWTWVTKTRNGCRIWVLCRDVEPARRKWYVSTHDADAIKAPQGVDISPGVENCAGWSPLQFCFFFFSWKKKENSRCHLSSILGIQHRSSWARYGARGRWKENGRITHLPRSSCDVFCIVQFFDQKKKRMTSESIHPPASSISLGYIRVMLYISFTWTHAHFPYFVSYQICYFTCGKNITRALIRRFSGHYAWLPWAS